MIELLIATFTFWFAELSTIPMTISLWLMEKNLIYKEFNGEKSQLVINRYTTLTQLPIRLQPFDCSKCFGFWLGLVYELQFNSVSYALLYAGCISFTSIVISRTYKKLLS